MTDHEMLERLCADMQGMKTDMRGMKDDMQGMKDDISKMKTDIKGLTEKTDQLDRRLANVETILENESVKRVQLVAEAHLDIKRRLDEVLLKEDENEKYRIQTTLLTQDVRELKEAVSILKAAKDAG